jgi:hypothetical protein
MRLLLLLRRGRMGRLRLLRLRRRVRLLLRRRRGMTLLLGVPAVVARLGPGLRLGTRARLRVPPAVAAARPDAVAPLLRLRTACGGCGC